MREYDPGTRAEKVHCGVEIVYEIQQLMQKY